MTPAPRVDGTMKPEAAGDELPEGVKPLASVLQELAGILPGLRLALERQAPPAEPPLAHRKTDAARLVGISPRLLERLLSAGKFPRPDAYAGRCPLWTRATLSTWVAEGGGRI
jgi:hypothetical protein